MKMIISQKFIRIASKIATRDMAAIKSGGADELLKSLQFIGKFVEKKEYSENTAMDNLTDDINDSSRAVNDKKVQDISEKVFDRTIIDSAEPVGDGK